MTDNRVALVCSVLNEASTIDQLVESLLAQTRPPDEIVFVDGGSCDGTVAAIRRWSAAADPCRPPIRLIEAPGTNIAAARNRAIAATDAPIVAVTDCGVRLEPDWLERLVTPFDRGAETDVVAGFFRPDPRGAFETALGATTLVTEADVDERTFLPSSRSVAFRREVWAAVGGYPEWLEHSEDVVFDLDLKRRGFRLRFEPRALVHFRPRPSLAAFFRQYYLYARGDGKADLWRRRHALRYLAYVSAPLLALVGWRRRRIWLALVIAGGGYMLRPYQRLLPWLSTLSPSERVAALAWVPAIRLVGDAAKMVGYPVGVFWRLRRAR